MTTKNTLIHQSAVVDQGATLGNKTVVWHFSHVREGAIVGDDCMIGQGCYIGNVVLGDGVRVQNNVSIYDGVTLSDNVFVGPSVTFTNVNRPRAAYKTNHREQTMIEQGVTIGANATIICGVTIGAYAFIAAGAVITSNVSSHALMMGVPAKQTGWVCVCGKERQTQPTQDQVQCLC